MLKVCNLYAGYEQVEVLKGINLEVKSGDIVGVLGVNGCGKSTLLKTIDNLIDYTGTITIDGLDLKKQSRKEIAKKIAMLSQMQTSVFSYTVTQIVMMGRYVHQKKGFFQQTTQTDVDIVEECMKQTRVYDLKEQSMQTLSGGQMQRVLLASVFAQQPKLILLDEPTNHLDLQFQLELVELIKQWTEQEQRGVIAVLHDINLALSFVNRIVLVNNGEIVCDCPVEEFDLEHINRVYNTDVQGFMVKSLSKWVQ